jgi:hypothetical protein
MNRNQKIKHYLILVCIGLVYLATTPFVNDFPFLTGSVWIVFWGYDAWVGVNCGEGFFRTWRQRALAVLVSLIFLTYFLPNDIRQIEAVSIATRSLATIFLTFVIMYNKKDDGGGGGGGKKEKVDREKLKWMPQSN